MLSIFESSKTNPLIVSEWLKSRFFKYLIFLSNSWSAILDDTYFPLFFKILMYSDLIFKRSDILSII